MVSKAFTENALIVESCRLATYDITYHYTLYIILQCQASFGKTVFIFPTITSYRVSTFEYLASAYIIVEIKEKPSVTETDFDRLELQFHEPYRSKKAC